MKPSGDADVREPDIVDVEGELLDLEHSEREHQDKRGGLDAAFVHPQVPSGGELLSILRRRPVACLCAHFAEQVVVHAQRKKIPA
jgi:hypothetical protein